MFLANKKHASFVVQIVIVSEKRELNKTYMEQMICTDCEIYG